MKNLPRKYKLNLILSSDKDLSILSNKRVKITKIDNNLYQFESYLKFYKREGRRFIERFLHRNLTIKKIIGNCSNPSGYIFN